MRWPLALSVSAYGVRFSVRASASDLIEGLEAYLPPGSIYGEFSETERVYSLIFNPDETRPGRRYSLFRNNALYARGPTCEAALRILETEVQLYVAEMAPDHVFVHSGVVGWEGRAILMPGRSFAGKSTLVAELIRAGAEYYSDEYAVLDTAGMALPYARPLSLRKPGESVAMIKRSIADLGGRVGKHPLPVGLVVVSEFRPGAQWRPERLSPGSGALALLANTVPARRIPEIVMATLRKVVAIAPVVAGDRGEAAEVIESILDLTKKG